MTADTATRNHVEPAGVRASNKCVLSAALSCTEAIAAIAIIGAGSFIAQVNTTTSEGKADNADQPRTQHARGCCQSTANATIGVAEHRTRHPCFVRRQSLSGG